MKPTLTLGQFQWFEIFTDEQKRHKRCNKRRKDQTEQAQLNHDFIKLSINEKNFQQTTRCVSFRDLSDPCWIDVGAGTVLQDENSTFRRTHHTSSCPLRSISAACRPGSFSVGSCRWCTGLWRGRCSRCVLTKRRKRRDRLLFCPMRRGTPSDRNNTLDAPLEESLAALTRPHAVVVPGSVVVTHVTEVHVCFPSS